MGPQNDSIRSLTAKRTAVYRDRIAAHCLSHLRIRGGLQMMRAIAKWSGISLLFVGVSFAGFAYALLFL